MIPESSPSAHFKAGRLVGNMILTIGFSRAVEDFNVLGEVDGVPAVCNYVKVPKRKNTTERIPLEVFVPDAEGPKGFLCEIVLEKGSDRHRFLEALRNLNQAENGSKVSRAHLEEIDGRLIYATADFENEEFYSCECSAHGDLSWEKICPARGIPCAVARIPGIRKALSS